MTIANVIKVNGDTINNKILNSNAICLHIEKVLSNLKNINIDVKNNYNLLHGYVLQKEAIIEVLEERDKYYVNSTNGVDEEDSGTQSKPFKTLDYAIIQIHTRNIKNLNLNIVDEKKSLFLLNSNIETLDENINEENKQYLYNIISRAYENRDIQIYLDIGEYFLSNRIIFNGIANKNLYIVGKGKETTLKFMPRFSSSTSGTLNFNVHFYKMIITGDSQISGANYLLASCNLHLKNVLFKDCPVITYGFWSSHDATLNKSTMQNCIDMNKHGILRGTVFYKNEECFGNYGFFKCQYNCNSDFLKIKNNILTNDVQLNENYAITDNNIDINKIGLYANGMYSWSNTTNTIRENINQVFTSNKNNKKKYGKSADIKLLKQTNDNFLHIIKNNKNINVNHLSSTTVSKEIYVKESKKILKKNIIAKEIPIYVKDNTYKYRINPIIKADATLIIVNGETQNDNEKVEGNIKGLNFIIQKGTFVEINLDFLKEDTIIESVSGLPEGLIFENNKIKGTPLKSGEYKLDMNISDDSTIECNLSVPPLIRLL